MRFFRGVLRSAVLVFGMLAAQSGSPMAAAADLAAARATALAPIISWVQQTGEDRVVPPDMCARFLILCGPDGSTFKFKSVRGADGGLRNLMWIEGRTALLSQTKDKAIYLVLNSSGVIVRIVVVNLSDGKERKVANNDPGFNKLLALEIKFWKAQTPAN